MPIDSVVTFEFYSKNATTKNRYLDFVIDTKE